MDNKLRLYNTLTKSVDAFVPATPGKVSMYTCGPTVYHYAHIGNLRTYIFEDVLERTFRYIGYDVTRVMNITDVGHLSSDADTGEDKMVAGARREHKSVMDIARFYTDAFWADCEALHICRPAIVQPATGLIDDFIHMVSVLLDKGYAYIAQGNVYFDTGKLVDYRVLSGDTDAGDLRVGVRDDVTEDTAKRHPADFVLWFTKSKFEDQALRWDSPWGVGYPGWHIECSSIAIHYLGEHLDIHCGGVDNIFPHHTNEIAQSEAYLGHPWCSHWFHVNHLNDQSGKMSKSKGGFLTVSTLEEQGFDPLAYRLFCLQSHYRRPQVYTQEGMQGAQTAYARLRKRCAALGEKTDSTDPVSQSSLAALEDRLTDSVSQLFPVKREESELTDSVSQSQLKKQEYKSRFESALCDDLNTADAVTVLYDLLKDDTLVDADKRALVADFDRVLGLGLLDPERDSCCEETELPADIAALIEERTAAKQAKDYARADAIRNELFMRGIVLEDTKDGVKWHKK